LEQIKAKTAGVPLVIEELTKEVIESDPLREEGGTYVLAAALTTLAIPSTLQDSLMVRLDRLGPVKEIALIGREFSHRLLQAVSPITGPALLDAVRQLIASELIYARGSPPEAIYVFKHTSVQDTAYASLLCSRRERFHAEIARARRSASLIMSIPYRRSSHIASQRRRPSPNQWRATGWRRRNWRCRARPTRRPAAISMPDYPPPPALVESCEPP
jgi:hypothetical protein